MRPAWRWRSRICGPTRTTTTSARRGSRSASSWYRPAQEPTDLPPGPEVDASTASPSVVEQKTVVEQTDLPKDTSGRDRRSRRASFLQTKRKRSSRRSRRSPRSRPRRRWNRSPLRRPRCRPRKQSRRRRAPLRRCRERARRRGAFALRGRRSSSPTSTGTSVIRPTVRTAAPRSWSRSCSIAPATWSRRSIAKGSGDAAFDEAALAMMRRSDPVPAPPPLVADEGLSFTLPVIFRVKGRT